MIVHTGQSLINLEMRIVSDLYFEMTVDPNDFTLDVTIEGKEAKPIRNGESDDKNLQFLNLKLF